MRKNTVTPPKAVARSTQRHAESELLLAALDVSERDWGTSVSELYHFSRMASMDRLRYAVKAALQTEILFRGLPPAQAFVEGQKILKERQK